MLRQCDICGKECEEKYMVKRSPSPANPKWLCWECYKLGQREMHSEEISRKKRIQKAMNARKKTGRL